MTFESYTVTPMELYIGADHKGFRMKQDLLLWFQQNGYEVTDVGTHSPSDDDDYTDYAEHLAHAVAEDPDNRRGVLLCGSGVGMAVAANKVPGIRAALIHDAAIAKDARNDDDINVLTLGAEHITSDEAERVIDAFLNTPFSGAERHKRRIEKITQLESHE